MKEFPTPAALVLASAGIQVEGAMFDKVFEAITYVIGWDVYTHELAEKRVWQQAQSNIFVHSEPLKRYGEELAENNHAHADILARCIEELGMTVFLPEGHRERTESPLDSLARIAPGKPVITAEV